MSGSPQAKGYFNSLVKAVRNKVSADKIRFQDGNVNLDLTYITERIIGVEATYRNSIDDVGYLLNKNHPDHFMAYNLTERTYDESKLGNYVQSQWCSFPDHNAPPVNILLRLMFHLQHWLEAHDDNVAVVHCLAGKGRTGTVIACFLLFEGVFSNADEALNYFAMKRSVNNWGVTNPSQVRAVHYFQEIISGQRFPDPRPIDLVKIQLHGIPKFSLGPLKQGVCPFIEIYDISAGLDHRLLWSSTWGRTEGDELRTYPAGDGAIEIEVNRRIRGDILVVFNHITPLFRTEQMFRFSFHTGMHDLPIFHFPKFAIDDAYKDKRFPNDFFVDLICKDEYVDVERLPPEVQNEYEHIMSIEGEFVDLTKDHVRTKRDGELCFFPPSIAAKEGTIVGATAERSGYLTKEGHKRKNLKRRWFVLKDNTLSYYKNPRDATPQGVIMVDEIWTVSAVDGSPSTFMIQSEYRVVASSPAEMESWIESIEFARTALKPIGTLCTTVSRVDVEPKVEPGSQVYIALELDRKRFLTAPVPLRSQAGTWKENNTGFLEVSARSSSLFFEVWVQDRGQEGRVAEMSIPIDAFKFLRAPATQIFPLSGPHDQNFGVLTCTVFFSQDVSQRPPPPAVEPPVQPVQPLPRSPKIGQRRRAVGSSIEFGSEQSGTSDAHLRKTLSEDTIRPRSQEPPARASLQHTETFFEPQSSMDRTETVFQHFSGSGVWDLAEAATTERAEATTSTAAPAGPAKAMPLLPQKPLPALPKSLENRRRLSTMEDALATAALEDLRTITDELLGNIIDAPPT